MITHSLKINMLTPFNLLLTLSTFLTLILTSSGTETVSDFVLVNQQSETVSDFVLVNQQAIWGDVELHTNAKLAIVLPIGLRRGVQNFALDLTTEIPVEELVIWQVQGADVEIVKKGAGEFRLVVNTKDWFQGKVKGEVMEISLEMVWRSDLKKSLPAFTAITFIPSTISSGTGR